MFVVIIIKMSKLLQLASSWICYWVDLDFGAVMIQYRVLYDDACWLSSWMDFRCVLVNEDTKVKKAHLRKSVNQIFCRHTCFSEMHRMFHITANGFAYFWLLWCVFLCIALMEAPPPKKKDIHEVLFYLLWTSTRLPVG